MTLPRLLILTDQNQIPGDRNLVDVINECAAAGATHVVVREHNLTPAARTGLVSHLAQIPGLTVISSRTVEPGAAMVQLSADQRVPRGIVHARSCHSAKEIRKAAKQGAKYAVLSPFGPTDSKPGYGPALDLEAFAGHKIPVFALGGITPDNAKEALAAGAAGVAVMGAIMRADDPAEVVKKLLEAVEAPPAVTLDSDGGGS